MVDSVVAEVAVKQDAPVFEGYSAPQIQGLRIGQVVDVLLFQEANAVPLSDGQLLVPSDLPPGPNLYCIPLFEPLQNYSAS